MHWFRKKIDSPGKLRVAVKDYGLAADNEALHMVLLQCPNKIEHIRRKRLRPYFDNFRHTSLTSGKRGSNTLLCKMRAASMRSAGVISRYCRFVHSSASRKDFEI
jgi:hypothetical protein